MGIFQTLKGSLLQSPIWLKFEHVRDIIDVLVICKYEENLIKNECARVLTRLYDVFSDAQGQLTPKSAA